MTTLERELAYSAARSDIECLTTPIHFRDERWYDISPGLQIDPENIQWVAKAVQYLESINRLQRHEIEKTVVRVLDL
jgi:hypothetical protein